MNLKKIYLLIAGLAVVSLLSAQTNSPYSRYGLGSFQQKGSTRVRAMGGAGIAMQGKTDVNNINPSSLVAMDSTAVMFDLGFHANRSTFSDGGTSESVYSGNLDYVSLMIPFESWWFFSASMQPVTSVGYNINSVAKYNGSDPSVYYGVNYNGKGGMSLASATNSFKLPWGISIGAEVGIVWGNHDETITETYSGMDVSSSTRRNVTYNKGFWLNTGAQYKLSLDNSNFILGATYQLPTKVTSQLETTISSLTIIEETTSSVVTSELAESFGVGLSYNVDNKLTVSSDFSIQRRSGSDFGVDPEKLIDNRTFALGGEFVPHYNSNKYYERVAYRVGVHYETGSFQVADSPVQSGYFSVGLGLPGRASTTLISVGLEFGTIGGFNSNHISENYGQVNIGLNLGEVWFVKPKFW